jgi:hypothetical protein
VLDAALDDPLTLAPRCLPEDTFEQGQAVGLLGLRPGEMLGDPLAQVVQSEPIEMTVETIEEVV